MSKRAAELVPNWVSDQPVRLSNPFTGSTGFNWSDGTPDPAHAATPYPIATRGAIGENWRAHAFKNPEHTRYADMLSSQDRRHDGLRILRNVLPELLTEYTPRAVPKYTPNPLNRFLPERLGYRGLSDPRLTLTPYRNTGKDLRASLLSWLPIELANSRTRFPSATVHAPRGYKLDDINPQPIK